MYFENFNSEYLKTETWEFYQAGSEPPTLSILDDKFLSQNYKERHYQQNKDCSLT